MGALLLLGTFLLAFGPGVITLITLSKQRPYLFLVSLIAALFAIFAMIGSGIIYKIWDAFSTPQPFIMLFVYIGLQEFCRPFFIILLNFFCKKLNRVNVDIHVSTPSETLKFGLSGGLGCGLVTSAIVGLVPLTSAGSAATYFIPNCSLNIYITTSIQIFCLIIIHINWTYLCLYGYSKNSIMPYVLVFIWHFCHGTGYLLNNLENGCVYFLIFIALETIIAILSTVLVAKRTIFSEMKTK
ncbi:hypothetical protein WA158_000932 [Blastocystis sp. Blastoise]